MRIEHIDQVLPHVEGRKDFIIRHNDGYSVIDYTYAEKDSFDDPARLECRGIKFAPDGSILARPFHKFFNIGEREDTLPHAIDFSLPHLIMHKLDGSMIHPAIIDDAVVFMTRMGRTDKAIEAESLMTPEIEAWCRRMFGGGMTPIFEYTSPKNRIVIRYAEPMLTLLAVRETISGDYLSGDDARSLGCPAPIVESIQSEWSDCRAFVEHSRAIKGLEGFVVRFGHGLWVKAKGEDYALKHKSKSEIYLEKNALALVLTDALDDVIPLLAGDDLEAIKDYRHDVLDGVEVTAAKLTSLVKAGASLDQKTFAVEHLKTVDAGLKPLAFQIRAGADPLDAVKAMILKRATSFDGVDKVRHLFGAEWRL